MFKKTLLAVYVLPQTLRGPLKLVRFGLGALTCFKFHLVKCSLISWRLQLPMTILHRVTVILLLGLTLCSPFAGANEEVREAGPTPPRLSLAEGEVSFWRAGAEDWVSARVNTPLAPGDALYTGDRANLELQIGNRAFVRADEMTQIELTSLEPDYLQFKVTAGHASFDLRTLPSGHTIEVNTPNAAFTIEQTGYYVVDVDEDTTHFITRRGGRAMVTPADGQTQAIAPTEELVVRGQEQPTIEVYAAPELDAWDHWNYDRSDQLSESLSSRYLPAGVYGADDLDHYGYWRVVPSYGPVWVPEELPRGWAPYSTGSWVLDPYYGWTWIDEAPWGWAPFHYGRWVFIDGYWAWAPGPVVVRPVYAPALVAFFGSGPRVSVSVGWVALGWGEPLFPWWGSTGFVGVAWWGGWGGPRVVNNVVINRTTVVNVTNITFRNTRVINSVVTVRPDQFGRGRIRPRLVAFSELRGIAPIRGALPVKPVPASLTAGAPRGLRPPEVLLSRRVVATRPPHEARLPWRAEGHSVRTTAPDVRIVTPGRRSEAVLPRPPFGSLDGQERARPPVSPGFGDRRGYARAMPERVPERVQERAPAAVRVEQAPAVHALPRVTAPQERSSDAPQQRREPRAFSRGEAAPPSPHGGFSERTSPRGQMQRESRAPRLQQEGAPSLPRSGPPAQAFPRERLSQEPHALPGKPANRTYPRSPRDEEKRGKD